MGLSICACGFRHGSGRSRSSSNQEPRNQNRRPTTCLMMRLMKPARTPWQLISKRHQQQQPQFQAKEKQEAKLQNDNNSRVLTLEEWIMSSPALNSGGDTASLSKSLSRKIHPSFDGSLTEDLLPQSAEKNNSSSQGKTKKRVSFRSPEVADIFVLHNSPVQQQQ